MTTKASKWDSRPWCEFGKFAERGVWIGAISISPDGRRLAAADRAGQVLIYLLTA